MFCSGDIIAGGTALELGKYCTVFCFIKKVWFITVCIAEHLLTLKLKSGIHVNQTHYYLVSVRYFHTNQVFGRSHQVGPVVIINAYAPVISLLD